MLRLNGKRIAVFVDEGFEDLEFWVTVMRLREEQATVSIIGTQAKRTVTGKHGLPATSDVAASDLKPGDFDATVAPVDGRPTSSGAILPSLASFGRCTNRTRSSA